MATDGAAVRSDDPALNDALSELVSEGVDLNAASSLPSDDLPEPPAPQPTVSDGAPTESAQPTPAAGDVTVPTSTAPADDPLAGTEPFAYGDTKTPIPGMYRAPGEGLFVPEDQAPAVEHYIATLDKAARDNFERVSQYERLSEWHRSGPDGKDEVLRGPDAVQEMRLQLVRQAIEIQTYESQFQDATRLVGLLAQDEKGNFVVDPDKLRTLAMEMTLRQQAAEQQVRQDLTTRLHPPPAAPDYAAQYGDATITQLAGAHATHLTTEDRAELLAQFNRFVAPDGKSIAPEFKRLVEFTASRSAKLAQTVSAAEKAAKLNAGMDAGRTKPKATPPKAPASAPPPRTTPKADWDSALTDALNELGVS